LRGAKQDAQCYDSDGLNSFVAEAVKGLHRFFELLLVIVYFFKGWQEEYFYLAAAVNGDSRDIPSIDLDGEDHGIGVREWS
jgi:hypothetical protein